MIYQFFCFLRDLISSSAARRRRLDCYHLPISVGARKCVLLAHLNCCMHAKNIFTTLLSRYLHCSDFFGQQKLDSLDTWNFRNRCLLLTQTCFSFHNPCILLRNRFFSPKKFVEISTWLFALLEQCKNEKGFFLSYLKEPVETNNFDFHHFALPSSAKCNFSSGNFEQCKTCDSWDFQMARRPACEFSPKCVEIYHVIWLAETWKKCPVNMNKQFDIFNLCWKVAHECILKKVTFQKVFHSLLWAQNLNADEVLS